MSYREYEKKFLSCDEAAGLVKSGDWVDFCQVGAFPKGMDEALARRKDELTDIKIRNAITLSPVACLEADPKNDVFTYFRFLYAVYSIMVMMSSALRIRWSSPSILI